MHAVIDRLLGGYEKGSISRRELVMTLAGLGVAGCATAGQAAAQGTAAPLQTTGINHVSIFVPDRQRSVAFYQRMFNMPVMSVQANGTNLFAGDGNQFFGIYEVPGSAPQINHVCFTVDGFDVEGTMDMIRENGAEPRLRMREDEVAEVYFADPDGISIQVQDSSYCGGGGLLGNQCA